MPGLAPRATAWACRRRALLKLAPPFSFLNVAIQQLGSSYPLSLLKRASSGVVRMLSASFMTSSMVRLARCKIFVLAQLIAPLASLVTLVSRKGRDPSSSNSIGEHHLSPSWQDQLACPKLQAFCRNNEGRFCG